MAGPLSGVGAQQVPIANTFQPGGQNGETVVRQRENTQPQENQVQPQGTPAAESQNSQSDNNADILQSRIAQALDRQETTGAETDRGSIVDIEV